MSGIKNFLKNLNVIFSYFNNCKPGVRTMVQWKDPDKGNPLASVRLVNQYIKIIECLQNTNNNGTIATHAIIQLIDIKQSSLKSNNPTVLLFFCI